jgi:hypothetical protein
LITAAFWFASPPVRIVAAMVDSRAFSAWSHVSKRFFRAVKVRWLFVSLVD